MKNKNIYRSILVLAIATIAAFNVNINIQENAISDVFSANLEALASESAKGCEYTWESTFCGTLAYARYIQ